MFLIGCSDTSGECFRQLAPVIICHSAVKSLKRYWNNWEHSTQREDPTPFPFLFLPIMSACRAAWCRPSLFFEFIGELHAPTTRLLSSIMHRSTVEMAAYPSKPWANNIWDWVQVLDLAELKNIPKWLNAVKNLSGESAYFNNFPLTKEDLWVRTS